jgi:hypothetical protein
MLSVGGAECRIFIVMLAVIKQSVSKLNVINAEYWTFYCYAEYSYAECHLLNVIDAYCRT